MLLNIVFIIVGIVLVVWGANMLTDGSVAVAERMQIPQIVISLTIVAMGTSMPEFCVSMVSALKGSSGLAIGNIVGGNTFNEMFIVGCAAVVTPITILKSTVKRCTVCYHRICSFAVDVHGRIHFASGCSHFAGVVCCIYFSPCVELRIIRRMKKI